MQTYSYDSLNRLTQVAESGGNNAWQEGYGYDQYGNVMTDPSQTNVQAPAFMPSVTAQIDATRNRVVKSTSGQPTNDVQYDDAGNVTVFPVMSGQMTYDAENRLTSFQTATGAVAMYTYDGQGRRVTKTAAGGTTYYVYGAGGELLAEYGGGAPTANGTVYQTEDHLGSTRAVTDAAGRIVSRSDYLPFGETIAGTATFNRAGLLGYGTPEGTSLTFTEHVGDGESALDYFGARYFAGAMGRFSSADTTFADQHPANPQSWNLYSYTLNNPLRYIDPNGRGVLEGLKRGVDSIGIGMISLATQPDRVAAGAWRAVIHPVSTAQGIGAGLKGLWHSTGSDFARGSAPKISGRPAGAIRATASNASRVAAR
jgi:RHS repeat-associated protein